MPPRPTKLRSIKAEKLGKAGPTDARLGPDSTDRIRLTADRILVEVPDESERRSKGGLVIPATAAPHVKRCVWSRVVLVGPETRNVQPGDQVLFIHQTGLEVDIRGDVYLLLRERDV